jgi:thiamine-monophosphate kinase
VKLSDIGEFGLIGRISPPFLHDLPEGVVGIGDDAAIIARAGESSLLVTIDTLVEEIHFLKTKTTPSDLGHKALAVNLSDIAAMGGTPTSAFLALGLPRDTPVEWIDAFFGGLRDLAVREGVSLLGGDTTRSPGPIMITITVLGSVAPDHIKRRSTAKPGDLLCVTGDLGDSGGGLRVMLENLPAGEDERYLLERHHRPRAHLREGRWLGAQSSVRAMLDVSDGIDSDVRRIMEQSSCGARIALERLPVSPALRRAAARHGWDLLELVMAGGEDYCLLLTVDPREITTLGRMFLEEFHRELATIGTITAEPGRLELVRDGEPIQLGKHGFDHFGRTSA